jgi:hypothetical protein
MGTYIGSIDSMKGLIAAGDRVRERFDASLHGGIAADVKKYLAWHTRYVARAQREEQTQAQLEAARGELADADAIRDEATLALDRALIADGAPKANSFKAWGAPAPSRFIDAPIAEQGKLVRGLVAKLKRAKATSPAVKASVKGLEKANNAIDPRVTRVKALAQALEVARKERDALERPMRRALSVLKLRTRAAELEGAPGLFAELFANDAPSARKREVEELLPDSAPTPPTNPR